jgi:preprotein translocase subunit SecA
MNHLWPNVFNTAAARDAIDPAVIKTLRRSIQESVGFELRDVQLQAAQYLLSRSLVQMQTGEGKTLAIAVAAVLLAKQGRSVMIATANEYLADRDMRWMRPLFAASGLAVDYAQPKADQQQRRNAYQADVVYGTLRQFAFDYLRDLSGKRRDANRLPVIARLDALIIDEADSLLIDEARTPLIIHQLSDRLDAAMESCFRWAADIAVRFHEGDDFIITPSRAVGLTAAGRDKFFATPMPAAMNSLTTTEIQHALERAILVNQTMFRDHQYLVRDDRIAIVDEYTGRASSDRTFAAGMQQAIEAREKLVLTPPSQPIARITVQDFVAKFAHLCGVTATAMGDRDELRRVYRFRVFEVPPHLPCRRVMLETIVAAGQEDKCEQIVREVKEILAQRRAVLIGTRTIEQSEALSVVLQGAGVDHAVLNARNHRREAEIVGLAGQPGRVTVATNLAGRGTDIPLDAVVRDAGGLHVIVAEMNTAGRIDLQLIGRCGRQGDPGSARIYVSLDDEIIRQAFGGTATEAATEMFDDRAKAKIIKRAKLAQQRIEHDHRLQRCRLTAHEANLTASLRLLGLDPQLDILGEPMA